MLELAILGFLAAGPLPGHELRRRITHLTGYSRPVSDGTLYPAINRLTKAGLIERRPAPEAGGGRYVLNLTTAGREDILRRLREPAEHEITDFSRWFTILAFLSLLPDSAEQHAVLRRRLDFLETPASFFYDGDTPLRAEQVTDPYRRGMLLTARATSRAERAWLHEILDGDGIRAADEQLHPQTHP
ncbi:MULTISPECIES: PadR family transcriptional regulator [unclassified Streptomyces]|uniref:PadR family transcriptional regulator n=1 Tax=unclassified Streptomyces TaxID=2593676 RepID=UPI002DDB07BD|nr:MULTISPECIES: PadR family transcriptional regulator [unclassified Streptomyces]WSA97596.1 PadR family transcriptional regulator [Streptomyces sp. NBC_01795]WSB82156.1 PadR family transcriptional regulator [Streptomyces sp. NBC_01775]WSS18127.1 PadR family transcriptional regulator [Streptomyces sp. NBC_01186]WSS46871.1 PadR family transcriptional regulator [Streptomyces sp. NBC_01187]